MAYSVPKLNDYSTAALQRAAAEAKSGFEWERSQARSDADWKSFRDRWLARKSGLLTQINDLWLKAAPKDAKREAGRRVNEIKLEVEHAVDKTEELYLDWETTRQAPGSTERV